MSAFNLLLLLFIAFDIVVMVAIARLVLSKRGALAVLTGGNFEQLQHYFQATHATIGEFMQANYGGDPGTLPGVLGTLMLRLEREARAQGLTLDRGLLKQAMAISIARHKAASQRDVEEALKRVA